MNTESVKLHIMVQSQDAIEFFSDINDEAVVYIFEQIRDNILDSPVSQSNLVLIWNKITSVAKLGSNLLAEDVEFMIQLAEDLLGIDDYWKYMADPTDDMVVNYIDDEWEMF